MLIGRHPTHRQQSILANGGPKTAALRADTPKHLAQFVDKMVSKQPTDRPSPSKVNASIETFLDHEKGKA